MLASSSTPSSNRAQAGQARRFWGCSRQLRVNLSGEPNPTGSNPAGLVSNGSNFKTRCQSADYEHRIEPRKRCVCPALRVVVPCASCGAKLNVTADYSGQVRCPSANMSSKLEKVDRRFRQMGQASFGPRGEAIRPLCQDESHQKNPR